VPPSIVPLSEVPRPLVEAYLRARTSYFRDRAPAAVAWKYYDVAFNRGRDRGFVWLRDDRVRGFIGLIPAAMARGAEVVPLAWTCDWGLDDPAGTPGMGVHLLRRAVAAGPHTATLGGNKHTTTLVPRMAACTFDDAGISYWRPLTSAAVLRLLGTRLAPLGRAADTPLGRVPIPRPRRRAAARVRLDAGIAPELDALFTAARPPAWTARYDVDYLRWALERCPGIVCATLLVAGTAAPVAGAVAWYAADAPIRTVRFACWSEPGARDATEAVVAATAGWARRVGAEGVATIAGRWDVEQRDALERVGLRRRASTRPLYVFAPHLDALGGLNYLATDLAQRF
jgi:hypothetical protein